MAICTCGKLCEVNKGKCSDCIAKTIVKDVKTYLYVNKNGSKLKRFWCKLVEYNILCYDSQADTLHSMMISLEGSVIKEEIEEIIDKKIVLYPFTIYINNKGKTYYSLRKDDRCIWMKSIREKIGAYNLFDYYDMGDVIGQGKFGVVKKAIHKKTQKPVAIKIMKKSAITQEDMELIRREIEILKMCQHPNIIRLLDIFENSCYIFLVLELLSGGDLFSYLETRKFKIPENNAALIIYSLLQALQYLHSYGIVHRDLKPENILMVNDTQESDIKISDFGLSKIIAPNESCAEPFGTLSYVAPEVLKHEQYDKKVDFWSLGVICYLLFSSTLPFDTENNVDTGKLITESEPDYNIGWWKDKSTEALNFTKRLLSKDRSKRMKLEEAMEHEFIRLHYNYIVSAKKGMAK